MAHTTIINPEIRYLKDILDIVYRGELRVPDFLSPFSWKPEDMLLLFESISRGYPIGSLVFWKAGEDCQAYPKIGPFEFDPKLSPHPRSYIIDGHQRIATLFGILTPPSSKYNIVTASILSIKYISFSAKKWRWILYYDLKNGKFAYIRKGSPEKYYIPLNALMNTFAFLKECRRIEQECKKDAVRYIEKAENLSQIFFNYKIPVIQIKEGNLKDVMEIFSRLNSKAA
ncbi:DUF262 domain-containing protein [Desulfobacterales bacterium HSG2]|nr:DUF262 domain-containing protein [Desulfobacterales bacterium HSG2]